MVLPGAQALLGFQLAVTLTRAFEALPYTIEARARPGADAGGARGHSVDRSGCLSPHRVQRRGYRGVPPHRFLVHRRRDRPVAGGIAGDVYVAVGKITGTSILGLATALAVMIVLIGLWYAQPYVLRRKMAAQHAARHHRSTH